MGQVTFASNTRHYYLTNALALEGKVTIPTSIPLNASKLGVAKRSLSLDLLRVSLDPEKALDVEKSLASRSPTRHHRNAVHPQLRGPVIDGAIDNPTVELKMTYPVMCEIMSGKTKLDDAIAAGSVEVVGSADELAALRELFERKL